MSLQQPTVFYEEQPFSRFTNALRITVWATLLWFIIMLFVQNWLATAENPRIAGALQFLIGVALLLLVVYVTYTSGPMLTTVRDGVLDVRYGAESPLRQTVRVSQIVRAELRTINQKDEDEMGAGVQPVLFEGWMFITEHNTGVELTLARKRTLALKRTLFISSARSGELLACLQLQLDQP